MEEGTCVNYDEEDFNQQFPMGCRYDWGAGLCLSRDIKDRSKGCANYFEGVMNDKIFPQGVVLYGTIARRPRGLFSEERPGVVRHTPLTGSVPNAQVLESFTIVTACFFCWKRKEDDVLATTYIYDEPWDPVKEGKLQLHPIEDGAAMGGDDD